MHAHARTHVSPQVDLELSQLRNVHPDEMRKDMEGLRAQAATLERHLATVQVREDAEGEGGPVAARHHVA